MRKTLFAFAALAVLIGGGVAASDARPATPLPKGPPAVNGLDRVDVGRLHRADPSDPPISIPSGPAVIR
jgi:hypothetical protein